MMRSAVFLLLSTVSALGLQQPVYVETYGSICDGGSHPLASQFSTLPDAQMVYPFVTSLGQEIDYAAIKAASNEAFGADGMEHGTSTELNLPLIFPSGTCQIGNDTWTIRNASGIKISGNGMTTTIVIGNNTVLAFDGLWYSRIEDIQVASNTTTATVVLDIDGNVPGHPYDTRGVQANTFINVNVSGGGSSYAVGMCRLGGSGGQCSENVFINPHFHGSRLATYYQNGYNALGNVIIGGDFQGHQQDGVWLGAGAVKIYGTSFESTFGYQQIINGGCDINASAGGAFDGIPVYGSRSESLCFYNGGASQNPDIRAFSHNPAGFSSWSAGSPVSQYTLLHKTDSSGNLHMYVATTAGTSGPAEPSWPSAGTVSDGSVIWTMTDYYVVNIAAGNFDYTTSHYDPAATVLMSGGGATAFGTNSIGKSIGWGILADGSNAAFESVANAQSQIIGFYANPQSYSQTLKSGVPMPGGGTGILTWGAFGIAPWGTLQLDFGKTHTGWTFGSAGTWMLGLPTRDPHSAGQLWNNRGVLMISSG